MFSNLFLLPHAKTIKTPKHAAVSVFPLASCHQQPPSPPYNTTCSLCQSKISCHYKVLSPDPMKVMMMMKWVHFGHTTCYLHVLTFIILEDHAGFIVDDEMLDVASNISCWSPLFFEDDDAEEVLKQIATDINAHDARSHPQHQLSDNQFGSGMHKCTVSLYQ